MTFCLWFVVEVAEITTTAMVKQPVDSLYWLADSKFDAWVWIPHRDLRPV